MDNSKDFLEKLYRKMLRIRVTEERLAELISTREVLTPCHLCSGQEAVAVGICACLKKNDHIFGNHRSHGHFLAKGGSLPAMVSEILCKSAGCSGGRGGSMHLMDPKCGMMGAAPIVAGTISLATGAALASKMRKDGNVSVSFFGDGATNEGVLFECLNFAALGRLPIIFVCENNLYSTHMPIRECRPDLPIFEIGRPFGIESHQLDGNDVLSVHEHAREAVIKCRSGQGPVFLECLTYRLRGHVGPDDNIQGLHTDIRPAEELEAWRKKDPILRFERYLLENGMAQQDLERIGQEVEREAEEAFEFARRSVFPDPEGLGKFLFKEQGEKT